MVSFSRYGDVTFILIQCGFQSQGQLLVTVEPVEILQPQVIRMSLRHPPQLCRFCLRQVNHAFVITKIDRHQLRLAIEAQAFDDQALEMAHQKIRQVEGSGLFFSQEMEGFAACIKLITMCARNPIDAVPVQRFIQQSPGSTISVGDKNLLKSILLLLNF